MKPMRHRERSSVYAEGCGEGTSDVGDGDVCGACAPGMGDPWDASRLPSMTPQVRSCAPATEQQLADENEARDEARLASWRQVEQTVKEAARRAEAYERLERELRAR